MGEDERRDVQRKKGEAEGKETQAPAAIAYLLSSSLLDSQLEENST